MTFGVDKIGAWIFAILFTLAVIGGAVGLDSLFNKEHLEQGAIEIEPVVAVPVNVENRMIVGDNDTPIGMAPKQSIEHKGSGGQISRVPPPETYWSYRGEGGPTFWSKLDASFSLCRKGKEQSPIDLTGGIKKRDRVPIRFKYQPSPGRLINDGHEIRYIPDIGSTAEILEQEYVLKHVSFHGPSEHRIDGVSYDMELQLYHETWEGDVAIIAILADESHGEFMPLTELWFKMPQKNANPIHFEQFDPSDLLPNNRAYYHYRGSQTTPPCSENIDWLVLQKPILVSGSQVDKLFKTVSFNARPIQALNSRTIARSW